MSGTDDPLPPDPWLREALRHAPDAAAGPPAKLDDTILRMGRAAVAPRPAPSPPTPPGWGERLLAAWDWLARPPVAAGFASVLVATVVGVMWLGRPLQEALPPREAPPETPAPTAVAPTPTPAAPAAVTAAPAPAPTRKEDAARRLPEPKSAARPVALAPPAPTPAPAPATTPAQDAVAEKAREKPADKATEAAAAAAPADRRPAAPEAPPAIAAAPALQRNALAGAAGTLAARAAVGTIETPGLSNLRFEIKPRPQAWTWQRDEGPPRPMDAAMQDWIALADRSARAHWNPGTAAGEGATTTLRFLRDGQLKATLRLGPKGLRLDRGGSSESAELAGAQTGTLASALDALGP